MPLRKRCRSLRDDRRASATATADPCGMTDKKARARARARARAKAKAKANTGVLRFAQDDGSLRGDEARVRGGGVIRGWRR